MLNKTPFLLFVFHLLVLKEHNLNTRFAKAEPQA